MPDVIRKGIGLRHASVEKTSNLNLQTSGKLQIANFKETVERPRNEAFTVLRFGVTITNMSRHPMLPTYRCSYILPYGRIYRPV